MRLASLAKRSYEADARRGARAASAYYLVARTPPAQVIKCTHPIAVSTNVMVERETSLELSAESRSCSRVAQAFS